MSESEHEPDFHILPATSTDIERGFSSSRLTVSRLRHSLSEASVRSATILGSWAKIPDLVSETDLVELIKRGWRAANGAGNGEDSEVEIVDGPEVN